MRNRRTFKLNRTRRKGRDLSTGSIEHLFVQWLDSALRNEPWRTVIRERLTRADLTQIQF